VAPSTAAIVERVPAEAANEASVRDPKASPVWVQALIWAVVALAVLRVLSSTSWTQVDPVEAAALTAETDSAAAIAMAREALRNEPLDGRPYRLLANVQADADGQPNAALLALALRYAPRDAQARLEAAERAERLGDVPTAIRHLDRVLRVAPIAADGLYPTLRALMAKPAGLEALAAVLSGADPAPWREGFLRYESTAATSTAELNQCFLALAHVSALTRAERALWVGRLASLGAIEDAWVAYGVGLTSASTPSLLRDGQFAHLKSPSLPFEWTAVSAPGVEVRGAPMLEGASEGVRVMLTGTRVGAPLLRQLLRLPTGQPLRVQWQEAADGLETPRGLRFTLRCAHGNAEDLLHASPLRGTSAWQTLVQTVSVPNGCRAEWLALEFDARIPAETEAVGLYRVRQMEIAYAP